MAKLPNTGSNINQNSVFALNTPVIQLTKTLKQGGGHLGRYNTRLTEQIESMMYAQKQLGRTDYAEKTKNILESTMTYMDRQASRTRMIIKDSMDNADEYEKEYAKILSRTRDIDKQIKEEKDDATKDALQKEKQDLEKSITIEQVYRNKMRSIQVEFLNARSDDDREMAQTKASAIIEAEKQMLEQSLNESGKNELKILNMQRQGQKLQQQIILETDDLKKKVAQEELLRLQQSSAIFIAINAKGLKDQEAYRRSIEENSKLQQETLDTYKAGVKGFAGELMSKTFTGGIIGAIFKGQGFADLIPNMGMMLIERSGIMDKMGSGAASMLFGEGSDVAKKAKQGANIQALEMGGGLGRSEESAIEIAGGEEALKAANKTAEMADQAINPGSIYTHDIHMEKILMDIYDVLFGTEKRERKIKTAVKEKSKETVKEKAKSLTEKVMGFSDRLTSIANLGNIIGGAKDMIGGALGRVSGLLGGAKDMIGGALGRVGGIFTPKEGGRGLLGRARDGVKSIFTPKEGGRGLLGGARDMIGGAYKGVKSIFTPKEGGGLPPTPAIPKMPGGGGKGFGGFLTSLAQGVKSFGKGGILKGALGLAAVGAAVIPFAFGMKMLADSPIAGLLAATLAIVAVGTTAIFIGKFASEVLKGALILALLGVALIPMGFAFSMLGNINVGSIFAAIVAIAAIGVFAFALGLLAAGPQGLILLAGIAMLALLGIALIPLALSLMLIGMVDGSNLIMLGLGLLAIVPGLVLLAMISPLLPLVGIGLGLVGLGMIPFGLGMMLISMVDPSNLFALSLGLLALLPTIVLFGLLSPFVALGAYALGLLGLAMIPLGIGLMFINPDSLNALGEFMKKLGEAAPALLRAAIGITAIGASLLFFGASVIMANGMMAMSAVASAIGAFFGMGNISILDQIFGLAQMSSKLKETANALQMIAGAMQSLASSFSLMSDSAEALETIDAILSLNANEIQTLQDVSVAMDKISSANKQLNSENQAGKIGDAAGSGAGNAMMISKNSSSNNTTMMGSVSGRNDDPSILFSSERYYSMIYR